MNPLSNLVSHDVLLGRWRLALDLFGRVFCDDVGSEPGSVISELGGFPVKESKFRREMEKIRNSQQRDIILDVRVLFLSLFQICFILLFTCVIKTERSQLSWNSILFICVNQVERDRNLLIVQSFKQLNTQYNRRTNTSGPPLAVHRVKVTFKDEPGEGSGVARSFYTAIANVRLVFLNNVSF